MENFFKVSHQHFQALAKFHLLKFEQFFLFLLNHNQDMMNNLRMQMDNVHYVFVLVNERAFHWSSLPNHIRRVRQTIVYLRKQLTSLLLLCVRTQEPRVGPRCFLFFFVKISLTQKTENHSAKA